MNSKTDIIPNVAREKIKELEDENDIKLTKGTLLRRGTHR